MIRNKHIAVAAFVLMAFAPPGRAQDTGAVAAPGSETRAWIELQQSNAAAASGTPRPVSGEVADAIHARYVKSFTHEIPEKFEREQFVGESK
jgi:hypothetical protein